MKKDYGKYIDKKRLVDTFIKLAKIYSPPFHEGATANFLKKELKKLGCSVYFDNAGKKIGGETGNLIAKLPGTIKSAPILLCAHMDMLEPCKNIKHVFKKDRICSDGTTIAGADCRSGITIILEVLKNLKGKPHPPVEIAFTIAEEPGMLGSKHIEHSKIKARTGIIIDMEFSDKVTVMCPSKVFLDITIKGVSAHAGLYSDRGLSSIQAAGDLICSMKLGKIDKDTNVNLGIIEGGHSVNAIPSLVKIKGQVGSFSMAGLNKQVRHIKEVCKKVEKKWRKKVDGKMLKTYISCDVKQAYPAAKIPLNSPALKALLNSAKMQGLQVTPIRRNAGTEANMLSARGIHVCNFGCGQKNVHGVKEYLDLKEFFNSAKILLGAVLNFKA